MHTWDDATVVIHPNLILKERDIFSTTLTINIDGKTVWIHPKIDVIKINIIFFEFGSKETLTSLLLYINSTPKYLVSCFFFLLLQHWLNNSIPF